MLLIIENGTRFQIDAIFTLQALDGQAPALNKLQF